MPLVNKTLPGLYNGVSQQPSAMRLENQTDLQENALSDLVKGVSKRPGTELISSLPDLPSLGTDSFVHLVETADTEEKRIAVVTTDPIEPLTVWDLEGNKQTVEGDHSYLVCENPKRDIRAINIDGETLFLNRTKIVEVDESMLSQGAGNAALIYFKEGLPNTVYTVRVYDADKNEVKSWVYTSTSNPSTTELAELLFNNLKAMSDVSTYNVNSGWLSSSTWTSGISAENTNGLTLTLTLYHVTSLFSYVDFEFRLWYKQKDEEEWVESSTQLVRVDNGKTKRLTYTLATNLDPDQYQIKFTLEGMDPPGAIRYEINNWKAYSGLWSATQRGSAVYLKNIDPDVTFTVEASDGRGDSSIYAVKNVISKFADLPPSGIEDIYFTIEGDVESKLDNYYVRYRQQDGSSGIWEETIKPGIFTNLQDQTLPHKLTIGDTENFTFETVEWASREVGDDYSNPFPSFKGNVIKDIFFWRNRLGFISGNNLVLSRAGDFYNLFAGTATDILDNDPIDVSILSNVGISLQHACTFSNGLLLFAKDRQFTPMTGESLLSPKTIAIEPSTAFEINPSCKPVESGSSVFFATPKGSYSGIREYYTQQEVVINEAEDVTLHVPYYIPKNVSEIITNDAQNTIFLLTPDEPNSIYVYDYYWAGEERVQSSWSKWVLNDASVVSLFITDGMLYMITFGAGGATLLKMDVENKHVLGGHKIYLDNMTTNLEVTQNQVTRETSISLLDYPAEDLDILQVVDLNKERVLPIADVTREGSNVTIRLPSLYPVGTEFLVGKKYTLRYRIPKFYVRDEQGQAMLNGRLQIRSLAPVYTDTGYFRIEKSYYDGKVKSFQEYKPFIVGVTTIGEHTFETGSKKFSIMANNENVTVDIVNDTPLASNIQTVTMEGMWSNRSRAARGQ